MPWTLYLSDLHHFRSKFVLMIGIFLTFINVSGAAEQIPEKWQITSVSKYETTGNDSDIGLNERVSVEIEGPSGTGVDTNEFKFGSLILFLDNRPLLDHQPVVRHISAKTCIQQNDAKIAEIKEQIQKAQGDADLIKDANERIKSIRKLQTQCNDTALLLYELTRKQEDEKSRKVWSSLLGAPTFDSFFNRIVPVGVGLKDGQRMLEKAGVNPVIKLELLGKWSITVAALIFALALILFLALCKQSNIIRDAPAPQLPDGKKPPYSLGKTQMAWWFFLVLGSYLFISVATASYETISAQALVLIGIAAGTGFGAIAIQSGKTDTTMTDLANAETDLDTLEDKKTELESEFNTLKEVTNPDTVQLAKIDTISKEIAEFPTKREKLATKISKLGEELKGPVTDKFYLDLVRDRNGVTFHRFQNVVWSVVLGAVFLFQVWRDLAMPEFSPTLLTLMGITSTTYLGFKFPEKK